MKYLNKQRRLIFTNDYQILVIKFFAEPVKKLLEDSFKMNVIIFCCLYQCRVTAKLIIFDKKAAAMLS